MIAEETAIAFAEWIQEKGYWPWLFGNRHWIGKDRTLVALNTKELFEIFIAETIKP